MSDYAARTKYDPGRAERYRRSAGGRRQRENRVLQALLASESGLTSLLDAPCGTARAVATLPGSVSRYVGLDASAAMLTEARARLDPCPFAATLLVQGDLERLPFPDRSFDACVCLRFLHHLPEPAFTTVLRELCRVTRRSLVVSFFHPRSAHALQRRLQVLLSGRPSDRYCHDPDWLRERLAGEGFRRCRQQSTGLLRELWLAAFERSE